MKDQYKQGDYLYHGSQKVAYERQEPVDIIEINVDDHIADHCIIADDLTKNIDRLHTTEMGAERIRRNLQIETDDVVQWCRERILDKGTIIERKGKNWYAVAGDCRITVNAHSYTIITAHKVKRG